MSPMATFHDMINGTGRQTISLGQIGTANRSRQCSNRSHICRSQFGLRIPFASIMRRPCLVETAPCGMPHVLATSNPLQVSLSVVGLNSIDVIDLIVGRAWSQECLSNQAVNRLRFADVVAIKRDLEITRRPPACSQDKAGKRAVIRLYPANSPEVADFVPTFVADDGTPFFEFKGQGGCGKLRLHREFTPFGATPGAVQRSAPALLCLDYSTTEGWA